MAGFHSESILFALLQSLPVENHREYNKKKRFKTLKSRQLERAAGSQAVCTFKYATLRTRETRMILSL